MSEWLTTTRHCGEKQWYVSTDISCNLCQHLAFLKPWILAYSCIFSLTSNASDTSDIPFSICPSVWTPLSPSALHGPAWKIWQKGELKREEEPIHSQRIRCACCGVLRDVTSPRLLRTIWSTGRKAQCFNKKDTSLLWCWWAEWPSGDRWERLHN